MNYKKLIALTLMTAGSACTTSNAMAHGGFGGGGAFHGAGGFPHGGDFRGNGFRREGFHHRRFGDRFFFFSDWDPFFYYPYPYYRSYSYDYYPYDYGYDSYQHPPDQRSVASYTRPLIGRVQARLARAGYYHRSIDGISGNETRRAIREYERARGLPEDGNISQPLLMTMGLSYRTS